MYKEIRDFILNGAVVFRNASHGRYRHTSQAIDEIRDEMLQKGSGRDEDKRNLLKDKKNISTYIRSAFGKLQSLPYL
ncbi:MAG: hypothetical protein LBQ65_07500 [Tannerellaceae bacterium]|jgi:hypothetical protein|nr:hypothetical protein [Tannerellaceae bacterium]